MAHGITRRKFLARSGLAAGAAAGLTAPSARGGEAPVLRVGVVTSLSGKDVLGGNLTKRGYDFWAETVNAAGGVEVGGRRVRVQMFYGDDQSTPSAGADAAERLIVQEKVDAIFGPYTSGSTIAVSPICDKYRVPMIAGSAESPNVWKRRPTYTFGMIPAVDLTAGKSLAVIVEQANPKPRSAAVIGVNEPFSKETAEGFQKGARDIKLEVARYDLIPARADLAPVVSSVASANPDIVAVGGHEEVLINFVKASKALGYRPKALIMHYGVTVPAFAEQLGKDADGTLGITVWTPDVPYKDEVFGTAQQYDQASFKRWGTHPDYTEAACSASGLVLAAAIRKLGKLPPYSPEDRQALNAAIEDASLTTFYGPVRFAKSGDHHHCNIEPVPVLIQIRGGQQLTVGPQDAKKTDMVYPLPAWT
ncbi:MAG TPA: amino acid ABC transporter substrate-binding protein [Thermodesulfobacteriota bacterium]